MATWGKTMRDQEAAHVHTRPQDLSRDRRDRLLRRCEPHGAPDPISGDDADEDARGRARSGAVRPHEAVAAYDRLFQGGAARAVEGHLRLGVVPSVITGIMPKVLIALRAKYPRLRVELAMGLSADLVERMRRGTLDAAIVSELVGSRSSLHWSPFVREPLVLIAPMGAPHLPAEELIATYPFIRYARHAWVGQLIDRFLKRRRLKVNETMVLDTLEAITTMVHHGLGVSVVPLRVIGEPVSLPVLRVAFKGPPVYRVLGVAHAPGHPKAALAGTLLAELKALAAPTEAPASLPRKQRRPSRRRAYLR